MRLFIICVLTASCCFCFFKMNSTKTITQPLIIKPNDSIPQKNKRIITYTEANGKRIAPTYNTAVCTEFVIGILQNFTTLTKQEKARIRIITDKNVSDLRAQNADIPKGVYYALTSSGKGKAINNLSDVKAGDFVQFWEPWWGHCGIVHSVDQNKKTMQLYSSNPSTDGYGIQTFNIPDECWFVRLK